MPSQKLLETESLSVRSRRAILWSSADGSLRLTLSIAITIVLARLIAPDQFGLMAMVLVFSAVASVLADFGVTSALIQKKDATEEDESTAFFFGLLMSGSAALALSLLAPSIARFYGEPVLREAIPLLSIGLVAAAGGSVHAALLRRALNFRPMLWVGLVSMLFSGGIAVALAWFDYGVWALAWQSVAHSAATTLFLWRACSWRPRWVWRTASLRSLLSFAGYMTAANIINAIYTNLHAMLIGRAYGATDAGYYSRAHSTQQYPAAFLSGVLNRVAFPAFAEVAQSPERLRRGMANALSAVMLLNVPICIGMALVAEPLVLLAFGQAWESSAPLLQVLSLAGVLWPLQALNVNLMMATGQTRQLLGVEIAKKTLGVAALALSLPWGLLAVAWGQLLVACISFLINAHFAGRSIDFGVRAQLAQFWRSALAALCMAGVVISIGALLPDSALLQLAACGTIGASVYFTVVLLLGGSLRVQFDNKRDAHRIAPIARSSLPPGSDCEERTK